MQQKFRRRHCPTPREIHENGVRHGLLAPATPVNIASIGMFNILDNLSPEERLIWNTWDNEGNYNMDSLSPTMIDILERMRVEIEKLKRI